MIISFPPIHSKSDSCYVGALNNSKIRWAYMRARKRNKGRTRDLAFTLYYNIFGTKVYIIKSNNIPELMKLSQIVDIYCSEITR